MFKKLFLPNEEVSNSVYYSSILLQIISVLIFWMFGISVLIPSPFDIYHSFIDIFSQSSILFHLYTTITTNLQALVISTILSLFISYLIVVPFFRPFVIMCSKARFFGMVGFTVPFTLIFGGGHWLKVALLVFGMSVFYITAMSAVIVSIPDEEFDYARTLRMSRWQIVWEIIILGKFDQALEILRQNAAILLMLTTSVESLNRAGGGLGVILLNENKRFNLASVFALQLTIFCIGIIQDRVLSTLKRIVCPYAFFGNAEGRS